MKVSELYNCLQLSIVIEVSWNRSRRRRGRVVLNSNYLLVKYAKFDRSFRPRNYCVHCVWLEPFMEVSGVISCHVNACKVSVSKPFAITIFA